MIRRILVAMIVILVVAVGVCFVVLPPYFENRMAGTFGSPVKVSDAARILHATLRIADLHADSLIWKRGGGSPIALRQQEESTMRPFTWQTEAML